ncbi:uncharacterized protein PV09_03736 [Verruconis gallopava]|uniref:U3 small nucleolar RNA-associated protein 25 n=1 Tax=Verruconis gallopava TaxID=253628 RepID=A0A0D2ADX3_9PEZI|nr:uncharacterized protein PV09_03736 [Verruconis gallopava]KIW05188.1 hypothetical protein PV09_03736 [Verruconis gallopava]
MAPALAKKGRRNGRREQRKHRKTYEASRLQDSDNEAENQTEDDQELNHSDDHAEDLSSEEDDLPTQKQNAYATLLQSFGKVAQDDEPRRKRRKLTTGIEKSGRSTLDNHAPGSLVDSAVDQTLAEDLQDAVVDEHEEESADEDEDASDAFDIHFANPDQDELSKRINEISSQQWHSNSLNLNAGNTWRVSTPGPATADKANAVTLQFPHLSSFKIKRKLNSQASDIFKELSGPEQSFASSLLKYNDTLFPARAVPNSTTLRNVTCLHALNHIFKTRDRILKNNSRLAKDDTLEYRDQGFTRPKVLILLPTRQSCVRYVESIVKICQPEQQENKKRFEDLYVADLDLGMERPDDYKELFEGNDDDMFRIGIKFTRKTVKFFTQFYNSDLILASPLGLRQAISGRKADSDFLSSIEIVILDQADALLMQNWDHVIHCLDHLNQQPKEAHGCDFSRVRSWYLDGHAKYLRQTILLASYLAPQHLALFASQAYNISGKAVYQPEYTGAILRPQALGTRQTFLRFLSPNLTDDPTARFKHFTSTILSNVIKMPRNPDGSGLGLLIYIPDSFDFPRLRNHFSFHPSCTNISFGTVDENHSPASRELRRARSHFASGRHSVLLYTERAHHFFRYKIKGVKKVVFYGVPTNPIFYEEVTALLEQEGKNGDVRCLFSKWERAALERVVGSERVGKMVKEKGGDIFEFL